MIRLIVTDMDGTLLHDHATSVNPQYFEAIREMKKRNILFCAASGRQYESLRTLFAPVKDDILYITENGTEIMYQNKCIFSMPMTMEVSRQLVKDTRSIAKAESMYCVGDRAYFEKGDWNVYHLMKDEYHFKCEMVEDLLELKVPCLKFSLYLPEHVNEITAEWFIPKWKKTHEVACGGQYFMDVMERNANKGTALKRMQSILGIRKEETAVFGDNHNDLEMLAEAGESYAGANAREEVQAAAMEVIPSNNEDGVLNQIKKILEKNDI